MALKMVKGNLERMFDKNLTDLVRGIRNNKDNEAKYIAQCIEEIKQELRQDNVNVKSNAVAKLTYLQMCGYDISWAGFNIIEVMSSNRFTCKRIGYLAASQCFHPDSELLMLTTNMIRKDLSSTNQYDAGVALSGLSCFISTDLSRDLANDIMTLMSSTKPYLRMKAVLMMYKVFLRYPEALRPAFPKLKEKLEDPDPSVQSAAVNVICELARKNPKNYLSLAPIFFKLMTTSTNNWMLIKIIKLFGALTPLEPRLGKKLIEPLTNLIHSTSAMSLLYECINTVIAVLISISSGMPNHSASIQLCVQKLRILIEDSDQNLKYLGLLAMSKILKTHPKSVQTHKDLILACLDDKDESIRLRALDLLYGMVSKKNLMEIVRRLLGHMERAEGSSYRDELLYKVIEICSQGSYQYVTNFEWYLTVLVELILLESGSRHGRLIAAQLLDVAIRVQAVRTFAVNEMATLLDTYPVTAAPNGTMQEVLYAAAWIVGEFATHLEGPERTLSVLLQPKPVAGHIQAVYVQNALKLFAHLVDEAVRNRDAAAIDRYCQKLHEGLRSYLSSADIEVQERASSVFFLVALLRESLGAAEQTVSLSGLLEITSDTRTGAPVEVGDEHISNSMTNDTSGYTCAAWDEIEQIATDLQGLFVSELNPVAPKAQRKVQLPDDLDLDEWINQPPPSADASSADGGSSDEDSKFPLFLTDSAGRSGAGGERETNDGGGGSRSYKRIEYTQEELDKMRQTRLLEQTNNPNYLKPAKKKAPSADCQQQHDGYDDIPIAEIALEVPLQIHSTKRSDKYLMDADRSTRVFVGKGGGSSRKSKGEKCASSKKSKRHGKKTKRCSDESDSESDDPKPLHVVNTVIELPEGAILSDTEDKNNADPNDPHRALDIDLDAPFDDDYPADMKRKSANAIQHHSMMLLRDGEVGTNAKAITRTDPIGPSKEQYLLRHGSRSSSKHANPTIDTSIVLQNHTQEKQKKKKKSSDKEQSSSAAIKKTPNANEDTMMLMIDEEPCKTEQTKGAKGRTKKEDKDGAVANEELEETKSKKKKHSKKSSKHHHHSKRNEDRQKAGYEEMPAQAAVGNEAGRKDAI
ncbi:AP-3 complex subunit delta-like [Anopheles stephensi]|uniref:AP-3 complex subunit delta-like n=1 Tax=Anopheles stephensi TaxID=30069 RepID=UPI001658A1E1|nr:AP-3 complex subunit delta-like [Anopheles stephensi]XP_035912419.1 AP-3 complex subunit delta-like [Anopheles stephensi]XP_035912427.1 AP-3 complex subunit delta-like [Anopheles stephensi]XP_035912435.1 AP-3 complex subunit delta-like [Anopheles stephensi]XP_035918208.1 AP-3 complex subunit delta-like [Anopheles stephensi]XP_035918209.1 AP-3 complex subunit delta-like [Anopheles stephensi]XP_035918210.1 AP-3 complex subunit delta-like [Anopheles stephensi]